MRSIIFKLLNSYKWSFVIIVVFVNISLTLHLASANELIPAQVSIFYPNEENPSIGGYKGLMIDSNDIIFPFYAGGVYRILQDGTVVNGSSNLFSRQTSGRGLMDIVLDENGGRFYAIETDTVTYADFSEGSGFYDLITGLGFGTADGGITQGQGPLAGSLFISDGLANDGQGNRIIQITLSLLPEIQSYTYYSF